MNCIILLLLLFCGGNSCSNGCSCIGNRHFPGEMTEDARPVDVSRIPENMGNRKAPELSWQFRGLFCLKD